MFVETVQTYSPWRLVRWRRSDRRIATGSFQNDDFKGTQQVHLMLRWLISFCFYFMPQESIEQVSFVMKETTSIHRRPDLMVCKTLNLSCLTGFQALLGFWLFTSDEHPWHSVTKRKGNSKHESRGNDSIDTVSLSKTTNPTIYDYLMPRVEGHGWHHPNSRLLAWSLAPRQVLSLHDSSYLKNIVLVSLKKAETCGGIWLSTWDQNIKIYVESKMKMFEFWAHQTTEKYLRYPSCALWKCTYARIILNSVPIRRTLGWGAGRTDIAVPEDGLFQSLSMYSVAFSSVDLIKTKEKTRQMMMCIPL